MRGYEVGRVDGLVDKGWGEGGEDGMGERVEEGVDEGMAESVEE